MSRSADLTKLYDGDFYDGQREGSRASAEIAVALILDMLSPKSVIDIGTGVGHWPTTFKKMGVPLVRGIDGPWARNSAQQLGNDEFIPCDFSIEPMPFDLGLKDKSFDLVTSFEFGEHIVEGRADALVDLACRLSDVVLFGGDLPGAGGTNHVNEQWPAYWREKFNARGYVACDFFRPMLWTGHGGEYWYPQNTICYFKGAAPARVMKAATEAWAAFATSAPSIVHPELWEAKCAIGWRELTLQRIRDAKRRLVG